MSLGIETQSDVIRGARNKTNALAINSGTGGISGRATRSRRNPEGRGCE